MRAQHQEPQNLWKPIKAWPAGPQPGSSRRSTRCRLVIRPSKWTKGTRNLLVGSAARIRNSNSTRDCYCSTAPTGRR